MPSKNEIISKIDALINQTETRESVSAWAFKYIDDDYLDVNDEDVWNALVGLCASDQLGDENSYLYNELDFEDWKNRLDK